MNHRLGDLQKTLKGGQAILISDPSWTEYYSGFVQLVHEEREAFLTITQTHSTLLHAHFSPLPPSWNGATKAGVSATAVERHLADIVQTENVHEILIDEHSLTLAEYRAIERVGASTSNTDMAKLWQQRMIKDVQEQANIAQAAQQTSQAAQRIQAELRPGISEQHLAEMLAETGRLLGAHQLAFPTIVAFGEHSALPHHQPTDKVLEENMAVLIDFGLKHNGYCADMTRSFWFGNNPPPRYTQIEIAVKDAYKKAMALLGSGSTITAADVDRAARDHLAKLGFRKEFIHTTGHGLGLSIHEPPSLNQNNPTEIKPGMCITIEPGLYREGLFGYRWENTLLLATNAPVELTVDQDKTPRS
ncbi:MAG: M24 family metallopeptidase [Pseudomonadales bacterium]|nr:M24 family metallopeptidase [Candidatus Woesebacteria bacterium]MCB9802011.1 M24 family metallopeptidase [Pseudomonadales bacterium]